MMRPLWLFLLTWLAVPGTQGQPDLEKGGIPVQPHVQCVLYPPLL